MNEFERAVSEYSNELDAEAARLVRAGHPPIEAIEIARGIIRWRRKNRQWLGEMAEIFVESQRESDGSEKGDREF